MKLSHRMNNKFMQDVNRDIEAIIQIGRIIKENNSVVISEENQKKVFELIKKNKVFQ